MLNSILDVICWNNKLVMISILGSSDWTTCLDFSYYLVSFSTVILIHLSSYTTSSD